MSSVPPPSSNSQASTTWGDWAKSTLKAPLRFAKLAVCDWTAKPIGNALLNKLNIPQILDRTSLPTPVKVAATLGVRYVIRYFIQEEDLIQDKVIFRYFPDPKNYPNFAIDLAPNHLQKIQTSSILDRISTTKIPAARTQVDQEELSPQNVETVKAKFKELAKKNIYPKLKNYGSAYILFTRILGHKLGKYNEALMEFVGELGKQPDNPDNFSISTFINVLNQEKYGFLQVSTWQKIKLYVTYYLFYSWASEYIIPLLCNHAIDRIYDWLFGENGIKQGDILKNCSEKLSSFSTTYTNLLESAKNPSSIEDINPTSNDINNFISASIRGKRKFYKSFAKEFTMKFIPSRSDFFNKHIKKLARKIDLTKKSPFIAKVGFFLTTLPIRILKWGARCIEAPTKGIIASLIKDIIPNVVEGTVKLLQDENTKCSVNIIINKQLLDIKQMLEHPESETIPKLAFQAYRDRVFREDFCKYITTFAKNLGKILATKTTSQVHIEATKLKKLIQFLQTLGQDPQTKIFDIGLKQLIPETTLNMLCKYLHPEEFTTLITKLTEKTVNIFSPKAGFSPEELNNQEKEKDDLIKKIADIGLKNAIHQGLNEQIITQFKSLSLLQGLEPPQVSERADPNNIVDVEKELLLSLRPRLEGYIKEGIDFIFDENMIRGMFYHFMKVIIDQKR